MVSAAAPAQLPGPPAKPASLGGWIGVLAALTLVAAGAGGFFGLRLAASKGSSVQGAAAANSGHGEPVSPYKGDANLRELPAIVTNLADPPDSWVRLQAAIVFDGKTLAKPDLVATQISEDFLGFLRTLTAAQIGGASGLQHLREDLTERAAIRSEGAVREVIVENLVVQ